MAKSAMFVDIFQLSDAKVLGQPKYHRKACINVSNYQIIYQIDSGSTYDINYGLCSTCMKISLHYVGGVALACSSLLCRASWEFSHGLVLALKLRRVMPKPQTIQFQMLLGSVALQLFQRQIHDF